MVGGREDKNPISYVLRLFNNRKPLTRLQLGDKLYVVRQRGLTTLSCRNIEKRRGL